MRGRFAVLLIILLFFSVQAGEAQGLSTNVVQSHVGLDAHLTEDRWHTGASSAGVEATQIEVSANATTLGVASAGGWLAGVAGLAGTGYLIDHLRGATDEKVYLYEGPILGGAIGASAGPTIGAHLANNRLGNVSPGILANTALSGVAIATALLGPHPAHPQIVAISLVQIATGAWVEHRTSR